MTRWMRLSCWPLLAASLALQQGCDRVENPATGEMAHTTLSPEQEERIGKQQHPIIVQQFGDEYPDLICRSSTRHPRTLSTPRECIASLAKRS